MDRFDRGEAPSIFPQPDDAFEDAPPASIASPDPTLMSRRIMIGPRLSSAQGLRPPDPANGFSSRSRPAAS